MTTRTLTPFLQSMLLATVLPLFVVISTAFLTIPGALNGHPGEVRTAAVITPYHPT